jgi:hypothetical protein
MDEYHLAEPCFLEDFVFQLKIQSSVHIVRQLFTRVLLYIFGLCNMIFLEDDYK